MPQHGADYIKTLVEKRKTEDPSFTIAKMCEECGTPKSTCDKYLAKLTSDTSWNNVAKWVMYLGGSLDVLAGIQAVAVKDEVKEELMEEVTEKVSEQVKEEVEEDVKEAVRLRSQYPALVLLVESYEKEIKRISDTNDAHSNQIAEQHEKDLDRMQEINKEALFSMAEQHSTANQHIIDMSKESEKRISMHLQAMEKGRNAWRGLSITLLFLLVAAAIYAVWEFSNLYVGITGYLLEQSGLISYIGNAM